MTPCGFLSKNQRLLLKHLKTPWHLTCQQVLGCMFSSKWLPFAFKPVLANIFGLCL